MSYVNVAMNPSAAQYQQSQVANAPEPIAPLHQSRERLARGVDHLHNSLSVLEARLDAACRPGVPQPPGQPIGLDKPQEAPSEHRSFMNEKASLVEQAINRVESLLSRLDF